MNKLADSLFGLRYIFTSTVIEKTIFTTNMLTNAWKKKHSQGGLRRKTQYFDATSFKLA